VLGRIGGLVYASIRARQHEARRRAEWGPDAIPTLDPGPYRSILSLALPSSLTFALMATENALVNALLAGRAHATEAIASFSIYYRIMLFSLQPVIAAGVAMLPYAAWRLGAGDDAGVRRGLRHASLAALGYALVFVAPVMWGASDWMGRHLSSAALTRHYTTVALRLVPLACLTHAGFLLCRPIFEAMRLGRPGLVMAVLRYLLLTAPLAWGGMRVALALGQPELFGLIAGTLVAATLTSWLAYVWLDRTLPQSP
jgi:Na+-driven multidrug efflux pump